MLQDVFFTFTPPVALEKTLTTSLKLNAAHPIFEGHFPGNPIVPGVCMMQMVKEVAEQITGHKSRLANASEMKFLAMLNPNENKVVDLELTISSLDESSIKVTAKIYKESTVFFKFKGTFIPFA